MAPFYKKFSINSILHFSISFISTQFSQSERISICQILAPHSQMTTEIYCCVYFYQNFLFFCLLYFQSHVSILALHLHFKGESIHLPRLFQKNDFFLSVTGPTQLYFLSVLLIICLSCMFKVNKQTKIIYSLSKD